MKPFFRFLTAEVNGAYLQALHNFLNKYITELYETFSYFRNVQLKFGYDIVGNEVPMRPEDLIGIGKIAGVTQPYISAESNTGSLVFTRGTHAPYTERGLFNTENEDFEIKRTEQEDYSTDITTLATPTLRASFPPSSFDPLYPSEVLYPSVSLLPADLNLNKAIKGWIPFGVDVLDTEGNLIPGRILPALPEPTDGYHYPFFGVEYLFTAETFFKFAFLELEIYKQYFECCQRIRRNGPSTAELAYSAKILTEDYVRIVSIGMSGHIIVIFYSLDEFSSLDQKTKKLFVWKQLVENKFKQCLLEEVYNG
jgi:hypothetical protein